MVIKVLQYVFVAVLFTSCLGNYPTINTTTPSAKSKEESVKECVTNHIKKSFEGQGTYKNFKFGELYVLKPAEIIELDKLIDFKNQLPLKSAQYGDKLDSVTNAQDVKIAFKKQEIKDKNLFPWYEIDHIFSLVPNSGDSVILYEFNFEVFPNYTVKEVHQKMSVVLTKKEYKTFEYFFRQSPVYESDNYSWDYEMNNAFYAQCFAAIEAEEDNKADLIKTIIAMTDYIVLNNQFDEKDFTKQSVKNWEKDNLDSNYSFGSYDALTPVLVNVDGQEVIAGYEILHHLKKQEEEVVLVFSFDLNFVLTTVLEK